MIVVQIRVTLNRETEVFYHEIWLIMDMGRISNPRINFMTYQSAKIYGVLKLLTLTLGIS